MLARYGRNPLHQPRHTGFRFSTNAFSPSCRSWESIATFAMGIWFAQASSSVQLPPWYRRQCGRTVNQKPLGHFDGGLSVWPGSTTWFTKPLFRPGLLLEYCSKTQLESDLARPVFVVLHSISAQVGATS